MGNFAPVAEGSPVIDVTRFRNPDSDPRGPWLAADLTMAGVRPRQVFELLGSLPLDGRSWRYSRERMQALLEEGRVAARPRGRPFLKRYLEETERELPRTDDLAAPLPAFPDIIREFSANLARRLAVRPGDLPDLEWRDLERALAAACEGIGFRTRLTPPAKDGGFDIELLFGEDRYLVEVKHWSAPSRVGVAQVAHFAEIVVRHQAARGLLLSSSGFRAGVQAHRLEVTPARVALGDGRKIIGLCQRYLESERGMWLPSTDLAELLFLDTF